MKNTVIHIFDTDLTASVRDLFFLQYSALCLGYWLKSTPTFQPKWILIVRIFIGMHIVALSSSCIWGKTREVGYNT